MAKYKVNVLNPGVQEREFGRDVEYTEENLREALNTLEDAKVYKNERKRNIDNLVGKVIDVTYDDGVQCTVDIFDEEASVGINHEWVDIAPAILFNHDSDGDIDLRFRNLFLTGSATDLVGETRRVERVNLWWDE